MKHFLLLALIFLSFSPTSTHPESKWDKDAGVIRSFTENATLIASSNPETIAKVIDGDRETAWQSNAPLPDGYINRADLNSLHGKKVEIDGSKIENQVEVNDGNLGTAGNISPSFGTAWVEFTLPEVQHLEMLSVKVGAGKAVKLTVSGGGTSFSETISTDKSYQLVRFDIGKKAKKIKLSSDESFQLFELAGMEGLPTEWVTVDLGVSQPIGIISCRYWPGAGTSRKVEILLSEDQKEWQQVADLNPEALQNFMLEVKPQKQARYIKVLYHLEPKEWNKIYLWEIAAYDKHGVYGPIPKAAPSNVTIKDMLGVNGIWGWGTNQYSDGLPAGQGPLLYKPLASHARNYHDMGWDVKDPDNAPDYVKMRQGKGTEVQWWLDWDKEYYHWIKSGYTIQATVQIHNFVDSDWDAPQQSAYEYAKRFAQHFGVTNGNGLICTYEAGNEPWKYDADLYKEILYGMAKGVKEADPVMEVFPCALQAADPSMEQSGIFKNYMGARISEREAPLLDGINVHAYSYISDSKGDRRAVHPEHPYTIFRELFSAVRFRDKNMPGKKIYLSEWGWDNAGGGEDCTHDVCVSEEAGAIYAVRAALLVQRLGIDRATWYFYANSDKESSLYTRSGYTGTGRTGFKKKKVYHSMESLINICGPSYFLKTLQEDEDAYVYLLGNQEGKPSHIAAWRPVDSEEKEVKAVKIKGAYQPAKAFRIDGESSTGTSLPIPAYQNGTLTIETGPAPIIIELK